MTIRKGLLPALILCLLLLLPQGRAEQDTVRLLLTKVETTDQVTLSLDGSYSIGQTVFQRGTKLKIASLPEGLFVYYGGMAMFCGREAVLCRHALANSDQQLENGIRFSGLYPLYPGDLHITVRDGQLRLILYVPIEEYLLGVVPYEMSDSWPLEALKAQSVAARTYALNRLRGAASDYDLVDNTNDQAFYGIQAEHVNAKKAIEETKGIVGIDEKGKIASCYYSASNGGRTETLSSVWSMEDVSYLVAKDDPYDLENPGSTVRRYTVAKDLSVPGPLERTFAEKASEVLGTVGEQTQVLPESIHAVTDMDILSDGKSLAVTLIVPVEKETDEEEIYFGVPSGAPAEGALVQTRIPVRVVYSLFPEIEALCGLDINSGLSNEIITVRETETAFVIEGRRFGHGVGMSQRGAQQMAGAYGKTWREILAFYYPGLAFRENVLTAAPTPSAVSDHFLVSPGPPATPTPRPTLMPVTESESMGLYTVSVVNIGVNSSLNLRSEPTMNGIILRQLYYGQPLVVLEECGDGWLHVKTDSAEGYVMQSFVERTLPSPPPQAIPSPSPQGS